MSKAERTRARIAACALELFEEQGFEDTTIAQVARAAGVTPMTVFRHFDSKERLLLDDPYDPLIAVAVGAQPPERGPLARAVAGIRAAWADLPEPADDDLQRRLRVIAASPAARSAVWQNLAETERAIADQLVADGAEPLTAAVAAGAVLAALNTALYSWAEREDDSLGQVVTTALDTLDAP